MGRYKEFEPNSQIVGMTASALTKNILYEDIEAILKQHKLDNIDPAAWYPLQNVLDILSEIASKGGNASSTFVSIGMKAAELSIESMPAPLKAMPIEEFYSKYDAIWQSRHKGDVGHVQFEKVNDNHFILRLRSPYPEDIFYGAFYAYTRHYCPPNKSFSVAYDEVMLRPEFGGGEVIIHIRLAPR